MKFIARVMSVSIVAHTAKTTTAKAAAHNKNNGMAIKNWIKRKRRRRRLPNWVSRNNGSSNRNILIQFKRKFPIHPEDRSSLRKIIHYFCKVIQNKDFAHSKDDYGKWVASCNVHDMEMRSCKIRRKVFNAKNLFFLLTIFFFFDQITIGKKILDERLSFF